MEAKNKLYDLEITPPTGVWHRIATELDDADQGMNYPAALAAMSTPPPAGTWQKIVAQLDQATLSNATAGEKLLTLEIDPPAAAWQKIKTHLDTAQEAAIPEKRRLSPLIRYAAAAVIIGLLAWGGVSLLNNKQNGESKVASTEVPPAHTENSTTTEAITEIAVADKVNAAQNTDAADEARNDAALEASKKTFAKLDISANSKIKAASNFYFADPVSTVAGRGIHIGDDNDVPQYTPDPGSEPSRYIMLLTPEGNIIRMSKKLSNMVCCVSGEEQDKDCKDQMRKWREKLACSPGTHSAGNFMDILSLASALQEDNQ